jgi:hypothetical protein
MVGTGVLVGVLLCAWAAAWATSSPEYFAGMTLTDDKYCAVPYDSARCEQALEHLRTTGADAVAIVVTWYQLDVNSTEVFPLWTPQPDPHPPYYSYRTATDAQVRQAVAWARQRGLRVMLKPHVDLTRDPLHWRGQIGVDHLSGSRADADWWDRWFSSYGPFLLRYADLAEETGAAVLSLSCELIAASTQAVRWRALAAQARERFPSGALTDAANWAPWNGTGEVVEKTWWDAVDYIGVDFYAPLVPPGDRYASLDAILQGWRPYVAQLRNLSTFFQRPVLCTEIGYCTGSFGTSCAADVPSDRDLEQQARFYEAALRIFSDESWHRGFFWWNWDTDVAFGGPENSCMTPAFKPAETVLRKFYGATEPAPPFPSFPAICNCTL